MANQFCEMLNLFRLIICRLTWRPERAAILKLVPGTWSTGLGCESLWCRGTMTSRKIPSMGYFFPTAQATPRCVPRLWSMWSMFLGLRSLRHSLSSLSALVLSHLRSWLLTRYTCLFSSFFEKNPPIRCEGFADRRGIDLEFWRNSSIFWGHEASTWHTNFRHLLGKSDLGVGSWGLYLQDEALGRFSWTVASHAAFHVRS